MSASRLPPLIDAALPTIVDLADGLDFLSRLPLANPLQAEAALHRLLDGLIAAPPPVLTYLALLEHMRVPLYSVEEALAQRYRNSPLPLGTIEESAFREVNEIWRKTTRAYAQCAQLDGNADDPEHRLRIALILHRCLHYTSMIMVEHQRARHELPAGFWLDLHGYYATAEEWGVATQPLADVLDPRGRSTHCLAAYGCALLMDLAGPYSLGEHDQALVRRWAQHWAPLLEIVGCAAGEALPAVVIDLMADAGLKPAADGVETDHVRRLDTSRLSAAITQARQQLARRVPPAQIGLGEACSVADCRRLLTQLAKSWSLGRAARKFRRQASAGIAKVAGGFDAMHFLISGKEFVQPDSARIYSRGEFDRLFVFRHMDDPAAQLQFQIERHGFRADDWKIVNQSANGFRLIRSSAGSKVAHGQLLAVRPDDGDCFFFAQICWLMQDRNGSLVAGIAALPGIPQAIAVRRLSERGAPAGRFSRGFLLPAVAGLTQESSLLLPPGSHLAGKLVEVHDGTATARVELLQVVQAGPDFERLGFRRVG